MKLRWKKGMILLQTLVMAVILSGISVMLMKWVLSRYLMAARSYRATEAGAHSQFYSGQEFSKWNFKAFSDIPASGNATVNDKPIKYTRNSDPAMKFIITADQD